MQAEWKFYGTGPGAKFWLRNGSTSALELYVNPSSQLVYRDSAGVDQVIQTVTANTWYSIKLVVKTAAKNYNIWVNGTLKKSDASFRNTSVSTIDTIYFATSASSTMTLYIDNVKVQSVESALSEFDSLYANYYTWLAGQFSNTYGGFYYARSSITAPASNNFQADIESTGQALDIINYSNLLGTIPTATRNKLVNYFQTRQDATTHYFYDPQNNMSSNSSMVARALNYSKTSLTYLNAQPLYPYPNSTANAPAYMASATAYRDWMQNQLNWSLPWGAGNEISSSAAYLKNLTATQRQPYLDMAWDFLENVKQDTTTGLWGTHSNCYQKVSGAFKIALYYAEWGRQMTRTDKIFDSTLACLRTGTATDIQFVRNPVDLLSYIRPQVQSRVNNNIIEIINISTTNLNQFLRSDGGFSRLNTGSLAAPNGITLSLGLVEGDMNASTAALTARRKSYELSSKTLTYLTQYQTNFWANVAASTN
jgi:hypothetical protein